MSARVRSNRWQGGPIDESMLHSMSRAELKFFLESQGVALSPRLHNRDFYLRVALFFLHSTEPSAPPFEVDFPPENSSTGSFRVANSHAATQNSTRFGSPMQTFNDRGTACPELHPPPSIPENVNNSNTGLQQQQGVTGVPTTHGLWQSFRRSISQKGLRRRGDYHNQHILHGSNGITHFFPLLLSANQSLGSSLRDVAWVLLYGYWLWVYSIHDFYVHLFFKLKASLCRTMTKGRNFLGSIVWLFTYRYWLWVYSVHDFYVQLFLQLHNSMCNTVSGGRNFITRVDSEMVEMWRDMGNSVRSVGSNWDALLNAVLLLAVAYAVNRLVGLLQMGNVEEKF